jgi:plasmid stabilization system protein ParE
VTRKPVFRPQADQEVQSARQWYEDQRPGLGIQFANAIDEAVERISSNPLAFPAVYGDTRRAVVRRFPYGVYFRLLADAIVVTAVIHGRRHPRRWQTRQ